MPLHSFASAFYAAARSDSDLRDGELVFLETVSNKSKSTQHQEEYYQNFKNSILKSLEYFENNVDQDEETTSLKKLKNSRSIVGALVEEVYDETIFLPTTRKRKAWDLFTSILVVYQCLSIPLIFGFGFREALPQSFIILELCIDGVFLVDVLVNFNTAYYNPITESFVIDRKKIAINYLKCWFWIDFISSIPLVLIQNDQVRNNIKFLKVLKLFRLKRLAGLSDALSTLNILSRQSISLFLLFLSIFFIVHIFACVWHYVTYYPKADNSWVQEFGFANANVFTLYIASYYYITISMLSVGFGDIHAVNYVEYATAIVVMIVGAIVFGFLTSKVTAVLSQLKPNERFIRNKMNDLNSYMEENKLCPKLRKKMKTSYQYFLQHKTSFSEHKNLSNLTPHLAKQLIYKIYAHEINCIPLFLKLKRSIVVDIVVACSPYSLAKGQCFQATGDITTQILFLTSGCVSMTKQYGRKRITLGYITDGHYFGDLELTKDSLSLCTYTSMSSCECIAITYTNFSAIVQKHYQDAVLLLNEFQNRLNTFDVVNKNNHTYKEHYLASGKYLNLFENIWLDGTLYTSTGIEEIHNAAGGSLDFLQNKVMKVVKFDEHRHRYTEEIHLDEFENTGLFQPEGDIIKRWDVWISILIIAAVTAVPFFIAFDVVEQYFTAFIDFFFCIDILITFNRATIEQGEVILMDRKEIANQYIKGMFIFDLISSVPFDLILTVATGNTFRLLYLLRLLRLIKLSRLLKLKKYSAVIEDFLGLNPVVYELFYLLVTVIYIAHVVACIWWGLSKAMNSNEKWFNDPSMVYTSTLSSANVGYQYLVSLYWTFTTFTTVGYGDIVPIGNQERILATCICFLGASIFAYIVANVANLVDNLNAAENSENARLADLQEYMKENRIDKKLAMDISSHYYHYSAYHTDFEEEDEILSRLPQTIANEVRQSKYAAVMGKIRLLDNIKNISIRLHIFRSMSPIFMESNRRLVDANDTADRIYYLVKGTAVAIKKLGSSTDSKKVAINSDKHPITKRLHNRESSLRIKVFEKFKKSSKDNSDVLDDLDEEEEKDFYVEFDKNDIEMYFLPGRCIGEKNFFANKRYEKTITTYSFCTFYSLSKTDILKLISDGKIGCYLQSSMMKSIADQEKEYKYFIKYMEQTNFNSYLLNEFEKRKTLENPSKSKLVKRLLKKDVDQMINKAHKKLMLQNNPSVEIISSTNKTMQKLETQKSSVDVAMRHAKNRRASIFNLIARRNLQTNKKASKRSSSFSQIEDLFIHTYDSLRTRKKRLSLHDKYDKM